MDIIRKIVVFFFSLLLTAGALTLASPARAADSTSRAGVVTTSQGRLHVRAEASSRATIVTSLPKGSYVTLIRQSGQWWQVEYAAGRYGYCHGDYITPVSGTPAVVATSAGNLNVRAGAGTAHAKTASLPKGTTVVVLSAANGWSRVLHSGTRTGYVSSAYLAAGSYRAISLAVPGYKQTDSRWAQTYIGSSGKTMAQIGCATTAVAMIESYRSGSTIYPDAMAKELRYTPSGSLYWPSHYRAVTDSSNLLAKLYAQLEAGKPVLLGARNSSGKQHWVVVTGFTGGAALTASGFAIQDPGSVSRVTLQQFLSAYPVFYKYFVY